MASPFDDPKVRAAIAEETEIRDAAYLNVPALIEGISVKPLTLRQYMALCLAESAFFCGREPTDADAALYLWLVSGCHTDQTAFAEQIAHLDFDRICDGIYRQISEALFDAPPSSAADTTARSYYSIASTFIDLFGREYGWGANETLDVPLAVLFQQLKAISRRNDPKAVLYNPLSDRALQAAVSNLTP
jgi:hypothetical protein